MPGLSPKMAAAEKSSPDGEKGKSHLGESLVSHFQHFAQLGS